MSDEFEVWIGCLACYNNGRLVGDWYPAIEAGEVTTSQLHGRDMTYWVKSHDGHGVVYRRHEIHEELWVMDVDNAPKGYHREMDPMTAQAVAERLGEIPENEREPFAAWCDHYGYDLLEADYSDFEDSYAGEWNSEKDYAYDLAEAIGGVPEGHSWPASYIDWDTATRDLFMDYTAIQIPTGGVWVFRD